MQIILKYTPNRNTLVSEKNKPISEERQRIERVIRTYQQENGQQALEIEKSRLLRNEDTERQGQKSKIKNKQKGAFFKE